MSHHMHMFYCGAAASILTACSGEDPSSASPGLADLPQLTFAATATIGGYQAEGVFALGTVRAATLLPESDQFAVVDGSTQEIHIFTSLGIHVRSFGGRGGGPGESQALRQVSPRADGGLCTWDVQQIRVTEFDGLGEVVGTGRADLSDMESIRPAFVGFLDDCSFVLRDRRDTMGMKEEPEGMRRDTLRFVLFSSHGEPMRDVATVLDAETWFKNRDGGWGQVQPILGNESFGFVLGRRLWFGLSDSLRWARTSLGSHSTDTLRIPTVVRTASNEDVQDERQRRVDGVSVLKVELPFQIDGENPLERLAEQERAGLRVAPSLDRLPTYDRAVPGSDGVLWLREFPRPRSTESRWILIGGDGTLEGQLALPRESQVLSGTRFAVIVLETDELDASLVRFLRRAGPG